MEWQTDWELRARMVAVLGLLAGLLGGFAVALHWVFTDALSLFLTILVRMGEAQDEGLALDRAPDVSIVVGDQLGAVLVVVVVVGVTSEVLKSRGFGGDDPDLRSDENVPPALRQRLARLAGIADVPTPDLFVEDTDTPKAYTTGVRQGSATVVVSTGLLEAVTDEELDAVLAHELAHVKNRDAGVMTAVALPKLVGGWLLSRSRVASESGIGYGGSETTGSGGGVGSSGRAGSGGRTDSSARSGSGAGAGAAWLFYFGVLRPVAWLFWWVGRGLTRVLSQYREFAADRGAAAITGSPAAVASALRTLDRAARERPATDVRASERAKLGFNVVPVPESDDEFDPDDYTGFAVNDVDGGVVEEFDDTTTSVSSVTDLPTHPKTNERIERLRELESEL